MRIVRHKHESDFLIVPNATVRDQKLSYLARGILVEILSRPDGWETTADRLMEQARLYRGEKRGEGRRAIRSAFAELEVCGYMHRVRTRTEKGRFVTVMVVTDIPTRLDGRHLRAA
ncbi:hypothetical protein [Streptomyces sp. NPDC057115]|uniref:hypothetical protein n=1 Tax=Streptomyces sp. NPDC057115 TaxID=3346022 RepID=UPI00362A4B57